MESFSFFLMLALFFGFCVPFLKLFSSSTFFFFSLMISDLSAFQSEIF